MAKKTTQSTAAAQAVPAMDYPQHEATYQLFLGLVKWGIVSMAFVVLALYAFIELHNPTAFDAPLFDQLHTTNRWRFTDGITFEFPPIWVPAGGFVLLVSFDPVADPGRAAAFRSAHGIPDQVAIVGPYSGSLNDSGEAIELMAPDEPEGPTSNNPGFVPYVLVERIRYSSGSPWPTGAAGTGWSLQKTQPLAYGNEPLNWAAAPATPGRAFTNDSDGDGMPDDWELLYELDPNSSADADEDPDNDGMSNLNEYRAGTNPRLASSVLAFTRVERVGDVVRARFHAVQGRSYTVEIREHLSSGSWGTLTNLPAASVTGEQEFEFQAPSGTGAFLRLSTVAIANP
ncbi:MAG TPA: aa3-type cytochrome c oxidase subunit IV [Verrucomicrobiota bacterium]|nr:aa3-type cytochrome c oxidase subunit IV [Verrucomicrobiota bacterium]